MEPLPRLSCERCKKRKIRCDKRNPCSACKNSNTTCDFVERARLPRGRSANTKKSMLEERVARLESLLSQVWATRRARAFSMSSDKLTIYSGSTSGGSIVRWYSFNWHNAVAISNSAYWSDKRVCGAGILGKSYKRGISTASDRPSG